MKGRGFSGRGALMGLLIALVPSLAITVALGYWIWSLT